ncbi:MAG: hypothetical protein ACOYJ6_11105 [Caulobacterales bacterium]
MFEFGGRAGFAQRANAHAWRQYRDGRLHADACPRLCARARLAGARDLHDVYLGVSLPLGANALVTAYSLAGLSDSAPD